MQIIEKKIGDLIPYAKNPRRNDPAVGPVAESIKQFGFKVPIIIDRGNVIVAGHTRLKAAKRLGLKKVPCVVADDLTPEQVKAFRLADNRVGEFAAWDQELLSEELAGLFDFDMAVFGFEEEEDPDNLVEDNYEDETPATPISRPGDLYVLGGHRLLCGDSTSGQDMDYLMDGEAPVFVFTDPPYGVSIGDKNKTLKAAGLGGGITENIENDTLAPDALYDVLVRAFANLRDHCDPSCAYYVSSPQGGELGLMMMMKDAGLPVRHMLIWVKNAPTFSMGRLDYDYKHEPIFYTWGQKHNFYGGYGNTVIDDTKPIDKMTKAELKDLVRSMQQDHEESVIYCDKPLASPLHPTMKPVKLVGRFLINSSKTGDICADIFGGSGTTMIACEQLGRRCFMMEKDPHYVDVIVDRWESFTGKKAERIRRDET